MMTYDHDSVSFPTDVSDRTGNTRPSLSTRSKLFVRAKVYTIFVKTCRISTRICYRDRCPSGEQKKSYVPVVKSDSRVILLEKKAIIFTLSLKIFLNVKVIHVIHGHAPVLLTHIKHQNHVFTVIIPIICVIEKIAIMISCKSAPRHYFSFIVISCRIDPCSFYAYLLSPRMSCLCLFSNVLKCSRNRFSSHYIFQCSSTVE